MDYPRVLNDIMRAGKLNQAALAQRLGVTQPTVSRWITGKQVPEVEQHEAILKEAARLKLAGRKGRPSVQAIGYVGAGAEIIPIDDHAVGAGLEEVEIPPGIPDNAVLVIVRGDSMYPRYFDGEYLFYVRDARPAAELTGRECVVRLADGRMFVKVLRRGSRPGLFNLESWNAPILEDQPVGWAAPVMARVNRPNAR